MEAFVTAFKDFVETGENNAIEQMHEAALSIPWSRELMQALRAEVNMNSSQVEVLIDLVGGIQGTIHKPGKVFDFICDLFDLATDVGCMHTRDIVYAVLNLNLFNIMTKKGINTSEREKRFFKIVKHVIYEDD
jgi:hypothetical protein